MLMLRIRAANGERTWHRTTATNADDGLSELSARGVYSFEAGDRLLKAKPIEPSKTGYKLPRND